MCASLAPLPAAVCFDAGQTGCRAALADVGALTSPVGRGPACPSPDRVDGPGRIAAAAAAACDAAQIDPAGRPLAAGLTGLGESSQQAGAVVAALRERLGVTHVRLAGDLATAHLGALAGRPGVVVAAGTGAVTLAVGVDGRYARVDGWGYLIGDAGGGFDVGRAGLRSAMAALDGRGGSAELRRRAEAVLGPLPTLPGRLHTEADPAGVVAAFAREVAQAAREGDSEAAGIWARAADDLAHAVATAARQALADAAAVEVACTGGMFEAADLLREPFRARVTERLGNATLVEAAGTSLDGAARLAHDPGPLAALVVADEPQ